MEGPRIPSRRALRAWRHRQCLLLVVCLLVPLHVALLGWMACRTAPTSDEVAHLAAGVRIWTTGRFNLYQVNPPLVKAVAAAPVVLEEPNFDWNRFSEDASLRREWILIKGLTLAVAAIASRDARDQRSEVGPFLKCPSPIPDK